jgi:aspartate/methionine/tyrosine aminotransferase
MPLLKNLIRSDELLVETVDIKHRFYASSSEPLTHKELIGMAINNGDQHLVDLYNDHSLGYAENGGSLDLREELANLYGSNITADNIVVFPGAQTGMTLTTQTVLDKGDHSIIVTPSYQSLEEGVIIAGGGFTRVALSADNGWQVDLDTVDAAIQYNTKYIVLNDPHNPTGALMSEESKRALIALAEKNNIQILSDEVYRLLEIDPSDSSASMAEMSENAIALGTMAKPYGAGGMCIGWVVSQDKDFIEQLLKTQHIYAVCFSRAGEIQAMMALRSSDKIIERNMKVIKDNLILLDDFFAEYSDVFEWIYPKAGGTGFVKFRGPLSGDQLAAELQANEILVFGPSIFDCDEDLKQYFRIGFSRKTMPAALEAFKEFVDQRRAEWNL